MTQETCGNNFGGWIKNKLMKKELIGLVVALVFGLTNIQGQSKVDIYDVAGYSNPENQKTLKWYRDAKFGMFVHWVSW